METKIIIPLGDSAESLWRHLLQELVIELEGATFVRKGKGRLFINGRRVQ